MSVLLVVFAIPAAMVLIFCAVGGFLTGRQAVIDGIGPLLLVAGIFLGIGLLAMFNSCGVC